MTREAHVTEQTWPSCRCENFTAYLLHRCVQVTSDKFLRSRASRPTPYDCCAHLLQALHAAARSQLSILAEKLGLLAS
jgi:hypothetical protein